MAACKDRIIIREVIIVEGKYDKNTLSQVVDATILTTNGFGLFKNKDLRALLIRLAKERGVIVLTDSDDAGMVIRNHINGILPPETVKHAYIPRRMGKEPRKRNPGAEGLIGVEGMNKADLQKLMECYGTHVNDEYQTVTKQDLYNWGLSGAVNSARLRRNLQKKLDLPQNLSSKALCEVLSALRLYEEIPALLYD